MPYKIKNNLENESMAIKVLEYKNNNKSYDEIANIMNLSKDYIYNLMKFYKKYWGINSQIITRYDFLKITNEINKIIDLYNKGYSLTKISAIYNTSERTVASWLKNENINIRERGKVSKINQDIFSNIDNEIKAYTIGLITADGSISQKGNTISICLQQGDKYILELINDKLLDNLGNLAKIHQKDKNPRYVLSFNGKKLCKDLSNFGIVPNKSNSLTQLSNLIPDNLYHHYLRGLYDGDGVCSYFTSHHIKKVRIGFCAKRIEFVKSFQEFFVKKLRLKKTKIFDTNGCWQCSWGAFNDLKLFYDYLYKDATIYLGRKKKKLFDYVNTEVN